MYAYKLNTRYDSFFDQWEVLFSADLLIAILVFAFVLRCINEGLQSIWDYIPSYMFQNSILIKFPEISSISSMTVSDMTINLSSLATTPVATTTTAVATHTTSTFIIPDFCHTTSNMCSSILKDETLSSLLYSPMQEITNMAVATIASSPALSVPLKDKTTSVSASISTPTPTSISTSFNVRSESESDVAFGLGFESRLESFIDSIFSSLSQSFESTSDRIVETILNTMTTKNGIDTNNSKTDTHYQANIIQDIKDDDKHKNENKDINEDKNKDKNSENRIINKKNNSVNSTRHIDIDFANDNDQDASPNTISVQVSNLFGLQVLLWILGIKNTISWSLALLFPDEYKATFTKYTSTLPSSSTTGLTSSTTVPSTNSIALRNTLVRYDTLKRDQYYLARSTSSESSMQQFLFSHNKVFFFLPSYSILWSISGFLTACGIVYIFAGSVEFCYERVHLRKGLYDNLSDVDVFEVCDLRKEKQEKTLTL